MIDTINYGELNEVMQHTVLENGLNIYVFPKKGYHKYFAMYAADYGSVDSHFSIDGKEYKMPAGIAHFLEHKMFEQKDQNALQKFAATGASPNAFTSQTMTAYHFECTDEFEKNLRILLTFVTDPYFTDENIEKEQGIIGQEIAMMDDEPSWIADIGMFESLYQNHPIRESIAGSKQSIAKINREMLTLCHETFYHPSNMALCIAGDVDIKSVRNIAEEITVKKPFSHKVERHYGEEPEKTGPSSKKQIMQVSMPIFMLGFKDDDFANGSERFRRTLVADLAAQYLFGPSSELFLKLYGENILNRDFEAGYESFPNGGVLIAGGESKDPEMVLRETMLKVSEIESRGIDQELFERLKKSSIGMHMRVLDSFDELCRQQICAHFYGDQFVNFLKIYDNICANDVLWFIMNTIRLKNSAISVVAPK